MTDESNYQIQISDDQKILDVDGVLVKHVVRETLRVESVRSAEIVIAFVDDAKIHDVNRDFLNHDYPTDVISFLYGSSSPMKTSGELKRAEGNTIDGELVISVETAVREANFRDWSPFDEIRLYLVHGLLHLCGYDDLTVAEEAIMRNREREILKIWNLTPHYG